MYIYEPNFKNKNLFMEMPEFIIHRNHYEPFEF